ncbi:hypothetical protein IEQ34_020762 [Dendrobium chrysotoxum]|uniref:Uncharacterized protein n=1 Tax=Dendrobium chrysotoxum TaxID=161865 RepID=A0AAV7G1S6_DENCH|nr:hypothetical protein IEQ34_020762 [Dendrobium chrysotoxum]
MEPSHFSEESVADGNKQSKPRSFTAFVGPNRACTTSPSNQVFVVGGDDEEKDALTMMVYDIAKDYWTKLPEID